MGLSLTVCAILFGLSCGEKYPYESEPLRTKVNTVPKVIDVEPVEGDVQAEAMGLTFRFPKGWSVNKREVWPELHERHVRLYVTAIEEGQHLPMLLHGARVRKPMVEILPPRVLERYRKEILAILKDAPSDLDFCRSMYNTTTRDIRGRFGADRRKIRARLYLKIVWGPVPRSFMQASGVTAYVVLRLRFKDEKTSTATGQIFDLDGNYRMLLAMEVDQVLEVDTIEKLFAKVIANAQFKDAPKGTEEASTQTKGDK